MSSPILTFLFVYRRSSTLFFLSNSFCSYLDNNCTTFQHLHFFLHLIIMGHINVKEQGCILVGCFPPVFWCVCVWGGSYLPFTSGRWGWGEVVEFLPGTGGGVCSPHLTRLSTPSMISLPQPPNLNRQIHVKA